MTQSQIQNQIQLEAKARRIFESFKRIALGNHYATIEQLSELVEEYLDCTLRLDDHAILKEIGSYEAKDVAVSKGTVSSYDMLLCRSEDVALVLENKWIVVDIVTKTTHLDTYILTGSELVKIYKCKEVEECQE